MTSALRHASLAPAPLSTATESTPTVARRECNDAIDSGSTPAIEVAVNFTLHCAQRCLETNATDPELREWHGLLRDIAVGLGDDHAELVGPLRALAEQIYSAVRLATRNPVEAIADRPPVRLVLETILAMGNGREQSDVRIRTGQSESHFSNILSLLKGYGLVSSTKSLASGRNRCLALTKQGYDLLQAARKHGKLPADISAPEPDDLPKIERTGTIVVDYQPPFPVRASRSGLAARQLVGA